MHKPTLEILQASHVPPLILFMCFGPRRRPDQGSCLFFPAATGAGAAVAAVCSTPHRSAESMMTQDISTRGTTTTRPLNLYWLIFLLHLIELLIDTRIHMYTYVTSEKCWDWTWKTSGILCCLSVCWRMMMHTVMHASEMPVSHKKARRKHSLGKICMYSILALWTRKSGETEGGWRCNWTRRNGKHNVNVCPQQTCNDCKKQSITSWLRNSVYFWIVSTCW